MKILQLRKTPTRGTLRSVWRGFNNSILFLLAFPYYRFLHVNTRSPLMRMAELANGGWEKEAEFVAAVRQWREYKLGELEWSLLASGLTTAAHIGAFSWQEIERSHWTTTSCWGIGLVCAVLGVSLSMQQLAVLRLLGPFSRTMFLPRLLGASTEDEDDDNQSLSPQANQPSLRRKKSTFSDLEIGVPSQLLNERGVEKVVRYRKMLLTQEPWYAWMGKSLKRSSSVGPTPSSLPGDGRSGIPLEARPEATRDDADGMTKEWRPRRKMVFLWQAPIMLMSYSVALFLMGTTVYIFSPVIQGDRGPKAHAAYVYIAGGGLAFVAYQFCTFWVYRYVDMPQASLQENPSSRRGSTWTGIALPASGLSSPQILPPRAGTQNFSLGIDQAGSTSGGS